MALPCRPKDFFEFGLRTRRRFDCMIFVAEMTIKSETKGEESVSTFEEET